MTSDFAQAVEVVGRRARLGPAGIVFCNASYGELLGNWLRHARACGFENIVVCALDDAVVRQMSQAGIACVSLAFAGKLQELWIIRARLFAALCREGIDFIHSDADAVWLRNPVGRLFGLDVDLVFSQGTIWPPDVAEQWGFVLCCGLFAVRAGAAASAFFDAMALRIEQERDDQIALNRTLRDMGLRWRMPENRRQRSWKNKAFLVFDAPVLGSTGTLTAALLPYAECPRLPEVTDGAFVAHPLSPKEAGAKIEMLSRLGLWD